MAHYMLFAYVIAGWPQYVGYATRATSIFRMSSML